MDKTMHPFIMDLRARTSGISKRIVLTDGDDRRALTAARYLLKHEVPRPVLIGHTATLIPLMKHYEISDDV